MPQVTSLGVSVPFSVGCHSRASLGSTAARQFVTESLLPEQKGHREPRVRWLIVACHT
jgi:hypothetical protein